MTTVIDQGGVNQAIRRRTLLAAGLGGGFASLAFAGAAWAKLAPGDIGYQTHPNGALRCDLCVNWQAPGSCKVVAGSISPSGWCGLFVRQAGARAS